MSEDSEKVASDAIMAMAEEINAKDAEIERLRNERMLLLSSNKIVLQPPAIPEFELASILRREIEHLNVDMVRIRQANRELAVLADERDDEIERLRATCTEHAEIEQHLSAEIERLRGLADVARLDVMWQELVRERDDAKREIERLRKLSNGWLLAPEIERLNEIIRLTYKMNCGRDYEHLELPEAVAAVRKKDWEEIERLRDTLRHVVFNPWDYDAGRVSEALGDE